MMARSRRGAGRRKRPGWSWPKVGGISLAILAAILVAAMFLFGPEPALRHPETMCPDTGPSKITAILVDTTDRVGLTSRADIAGRLDDLVASSQTDEMMVAYESSPIGQGLDGDLHPPLLTVCNPGDPETASEWTQSPELIRKQLEERFKTPLEQVFSDLLRRDQSPISPLMESIQSISVTVFARRPYQDIPKRLIVVSDLMQHTEHLSFFRQPVDYDSFSGTAGADALRTNLRYVRVEILFVQRREHERIGSSTRKLIEFWKRWIEEQGGQLERVSKIDGLN